MPSAARTLHACLTHAHHALIQASFHEGPVFRMGFDAHVQAWRKHTRRAAFTTYHTAPAFAAAYDAERARRYGNA